MQTSKALPNRQPETGAQRGANRMMTHGGMPSPIKTIQQNGVFCPSCGEHHRPGKTCGVKSLGSFFDNYVAKAGNGVVMSSNTHGNRAHDPATGKFTSVPSGGAAGGGGAKTTPDAGPTTKVSPQTKVMDAGGGIGTANTMQAPAAAGAPPATSSPPSGANSEQKTGIGIPAARAQQNQAGRAEKQQAAGAAQDQADAKLSADLGGDAPRKAGEAAYFQHRDQALAGGASEAEAHEAGKKQGMSAWDAAMEARQAGKQAAPAGALRSTEGGGRTPPKGAATVPNGAKMGQRTGGGVATTPSGPSSMPGAGPQTSIPLSPATTPGVPAPATPPGAPTAPPAPGTPPLPGKQPAGGKNGGIGGINPWQLYGVGSSIGAGLDKPGGTFAPTTSGVVSTAHGLLHGNKDQRGPASVDRGKQLQKVAGKKPSKSAQSSQQQVTP